MGDAVRYQVMPPLSPEEYQELHDDIAANGVLVPILEDENGVIIDGHHRSKIANELGIPCPVESISGKSEAEKRGLAFSMNLNRRHLNREQRAALVAESLRLDPMASNSMHAQRTGMSDKTVKKIREREGILEPREAIRQYAEEHPEKSNREIARDLGVSDKTAGSVRAENSEIPKNTHPAPGFAPGDMDELNNPQLDRVDPELEQRAKAMSSAPDSGQYINSDSAAARNEKRYQAMSTAREIIARQKDLIALLGEVGGFKGIDGLLDAMDEYTEMAREMSRSQDIDTELDNFTRGQ